MKRISLSLAAVTALLAAAPAIAGSFAIDLPRLTFPAPQPETSRDCVSTATVAPTCAQR